MFLADAVDLTTDLAAVRPLQDGRDLQFRPANRHARIHGRIRPGRIAQWAAIAREFADLPAALRVAQPYRFSGVDVMNAGDGIDPAGSALFDDGTIRLPSDVCWFEYDAGATSPGLQFGLLVRNIAAGIAVRQFVWTSKDGFRGMQVNTYGIEMLRNSLVDDETRRKADADPGGRLGTFTVVNDPFFHLQESADRHAEGKWIDTPLRERMRYLILPQTFALYLILALASNVKTVERVTPGKFANRRRRDKGLHPVPDHWLVTLPPDWSPGYRGGPASARRELVEDIFSADERRD